MVKRELWEEPFPESDLPSWPCPQCKSGILRSNRRSIRVRETFESKRKDRSARTWTPEHVVENFVGFLRCSNNNCQEEVAVSGTRKFEQLWYEGDEDSEIVECLSPVYFSPTIQIFPISRNCPKLVKDRLMESFQLFWIDADAAANRLRSTIEEVLTECKVPRYTPNRKLLTTHDRILRFQNKNRDAADKLLAIKWLGNVASHHGGSGLTRSDLLDGFELLEDVIDQIYVGSQKKLQKKAARINKSKGPVRSSRRR